ncbi:hypothetical protein SAMN06265338_101157 [Rhodoblastus acidophilus]|uniref:Uncharacterized protein n=1 Tax=Rhodoblastus acidophilus TaxID=1074 RepID=A0A212PY26_RHOAC|nr:hypothetical protein [Rhodoblastus acidophilus]MCW2318100.1 hypothetical protein [Rhodoblastus acidophilus]SNB51966.1 hypothetical protein SAMN06265338_101157 [Rhodoblastus acidophilus]
MLDFWYGMTFGPSELAWQSQRVLALRFNKFIVEGFGAADEAHRMVIEKVFAFSEATAKLSVGVFPHVVMKDIQTVVDENVERLSPSLSG